MLLQSSLVKPFALDKGAPSVPRAIIEMKGALLALTSHNHI